MRKKKGFTLIVVRQREREAFTLIELLVVVAIIAVLVAILMPTLQMAKALARDAACKVGERHLALASTVFSEDHGEVMPGVATGVGGLGTLPWQKDWLLGTAGYGANSTPATGTLYPYTGGKGAYRCPGLAKGVFGSGIGSNGVSDYQSFCILTGAKRSRITPTANIYGKTVPTPVILEAEPGAQLSQVVRGNNLVISGVPNATWASSSQGTQAHLGMWHVFGKKLGGNVVSYDGVVYRLEYDKNNSWGLMGDSWMIQLPPGLTADGGQTWRPMREPMAPFGYLNMQRDVPGM